MKLSKPQGLLSGFHAQDFQDIYPILAHGGEQWAPMDFHIGMHHHMVWELYLQVSGSTTWVSNQKRYTLSPGGFLAVPPQVEHGMKGKPKKEHHFYFVALDIEALLQTHPEWIPLWQHHTIHLKSCHTLVDPFRTFIRELTKDTTFKAQGLDISLKSILLEASRLLTTQSTPPIKKALLIHPTALQCRDWIDSHPEENWTAEKLSKVVGLSPSHLTKRFKEAFKLSPYHYLKQRRITLAKERLIGTDESVTAIGLQLGFSSSQHFSTQFTQEVGSSPRDFRKQHSE